jgi:hypothetical protein
MSVGLSDCMFYLGNCCMDSLKFNIGCVCAKIIGVLILVTVNLV